MLDQLRERADIVLVDTPPVLPVSDAVSISSRVDGMVVVSRLDVVQRPMLRDLQLIVVDRPPRQGSPRQRRVCIHVM